MARGWSISEEKRTARRLARLEQDCMWEPNTGCLIWLGSVNKKGYGYWQRRLAHQIAYELVHGPIPADLEIDHKCRVRCCVNVEHLEAVAHKVNIMRGTTGQKSGAQNRAKTHCPHGHEYSNANTYVNSKGHRYCRICRAECERRRRTDR